MQRFLKSKTHYSSYKHIHSQFTSRRCYTSNSGQEDSNLWVTSKYPKVDRLVGVTVPELLWSNLSKWENAPAFKCATTGRQYTHGEVYNQSRSFAAALLNAGLKARDTVLIALPNVPEFAAVLMGIWTAGLVPSLIPPIFTPNELNGIIADIDPKCVVTVSTLVNYLQGRTNPITRIVVLGVPPEGCHSYFEMAKTSIIGAEFVKGSQMDTTKDAGALFYSSGTSGLPKAVMLSHSNLTTNILQQTVENISVTQDFDRGNQQEIFMGLLPFCHCYGFSAVLATSMLRGGLTTIILPSHLRQINIFKFTVLHLVPAAITIITETFKNSTNDFEQCHSVVGGGVSIGTNKIHEILEILGKHVFFQEGYGATEMSPVSHLLSPATKNTKIGSCGETVPGCWTKVIDVKTGKTLGPDENGEIYVKGPNVMLGYLNNEKETKNAIDPEGWYHTGDIGRYDKDGYFYITGRNKDLIKVKGCQVAPAELENVLHDHPSIEEATVIGIPDEKAGQLPRAYIIRKERSLEEHDIHNYMKDKLASYKQLRGGIEFVETIPKNSIGKVLKRELLQQYLETQPPLIK